MNAKYYGGCDIGSTTGKAVILRGKEVVASFILPREIDPEETARLVLAETCSRAGLQGPGDLEYLVGTGYGRNEISFADENVSEISCHALGTHLCDPGIQTIVDIGGQDMKGISLNEDGTVREFAMNDKCAAGTGRFFEAMSRIFRMELEEFAELPLGARRPAAISAQCSVFAETEVISLLAKKSNPADIAAGIHLAVGKRCFTLLKRVGIRPSVTVTGGCAKNRGLISELKKVLGAEIAPLPVDPQIVGALGAAEFARRRAESR